jgi:SP family myo-inositol transporter-like MFS transporter 13
MITLGQVVAYGIGAGSMHITSGWGWMMGLGSVPAALQFVFLFFLLESHMYIPAQLHDPHC